MHPEMKKEHDEFLASEGQTPIRPTAAGRWVVRIDGEEQVMNVIDIDEARVHLFAVDRSRLVRSVEWWSEVCWVEWVRPEAFTVRRWEVCWGCEHHANFDVIEAPDRDAARALAIQQFKDVWDVRLVAEPVAAQRRENEQPSKAVRCALVSAAEVVARNACEYTLNADGTVSGMHEGDLKRLVEAVNALSPNVERSDRA